jgi:hypothetical protein
MTTITAINKQHQAKVNRLVKALLKYNKLNDMRDVADNDGDTKLYNKYDRMCGKAWDKYYDLRDELPKREIVNIEKSELY